jgi:hypothetical protein
MKIAKHQAELKAFLGSSHFRTWYSHHYRMQSKLGSSLKKQKLVVVRQKSMSWQLLLNGA